MLLDSAQMGPVTGGGQRWDLLSFGKDQLNLVYQPLGIQEHNWCEIHGNWMKLAKIGM